MAAPEKQERQRATAWGGVGVGKGDVGGGSKDWRRRTFSGGSGVWWCRNGQLACVFPVVARESAGVQARGGPKKNGGVGDVTAAAVYGSVGAGNPRMCVCPASAHGSVGTLRSEQPWRWRHGGLDRGVDS